MPNHNKVKNPNLSLTRHTSLNAANDTVILEALGLKKVFTAHKGKGVIHAVDGIHFQLLKGEILGLVGESGCGKTTTGRLLMKLLEPTGGNLIINGKDCTTLAKTEWLEYKHLIQMIFQDPYGSMNPHYKIKNVMEEPLLIHKIGATQAERNQIIEEALAKVKLFPPGDYMDRYPHMLSGGQRQRVVIARTLTLKPKIIVADEPVSMIDLSTRAEILHLVRSIQQELGLSIVYITHDISTARYFTNRIAVMYLGKIIEIGNQDDVIDTPAHPYTRALIDAVCEPLSGRVNTIRKLQLSGEIPSASNVPSGCRFHPRCPFANEQCRQDPEPELRLYERNHYHACLRFGEF